MGKHELIIPKELADTAQVAYQLCPGESITVPELKLGKSPESYPVDMLRFFRRLWRENGYARIKTAHDDAIILPAKQNEPPVFLLNSYRGISDGDVVDRQPYLKEYRRQRRIMLTLHDEAARTEQEEKLDRILKRIPDMGGLQGVETYKLFIPSHHNDQVGIPIQGSRGFVVSKSFSLGPERTDYDLPTRKGTLPCYPNLGENEVHVFCDGERYSPVQAANPEYLASWQRLASLVVPLLERTSQQLDTV